MEDLNLLDVKELAKVLSTKTKAELTEIANANNITITGEEAKDELFDVVFDFFAENAVVAEITTTLSTDEAVKKMGETILRDATAFNEAVKSMTAEERSVIVETLNQENDGLGDELLRLFPRINDTSAELADAVAPADDLPASQIIKSLPLRVLVQDLQTKLFDYDLGKLISTEMVALGTKQVMYQDFEDTDNKSGFADVAIGDLNGKTIPVYSKVFKVDTEIHKSIKVLDKILNDVALTAGLFIALTRNIQIAINKPIAKALYMRFIAFLEEDANYDFVETFAGTDAKENAKLVHKKLRTLQTTSRKHLKAKFNGVGLEWKLNPNGLRLVLNADYANKYKYDLTAGTFQLGEITLPVKEIIVQDFTVLEEYGQADKLSKRDVIFFQDGVYQEMLHYDATKITTTPKLFSIIHRYLRVGNYRYDNRLLGAFNAKAVVK